MQVVCATPEDIPAWLHLAAEVEALFNGPMVRDPGFYAALERYIARGTAFCVRAEDGPPGWPLLGGLLFSPHPPVYTIGWLAVAATARRGGIARALVGAALQRVSPPATLRVTTFTDDQPDGGPARAFYLSLGLRPAERIDTEFGPRQVFSRDL
jgi:GNAT superfamily N-acetyltransferase